MQIVSLIGYYECSGWMYMINGVVLIDGVCMVLWEVLDWIVVGWL